MKTRTLLAISALACLPQYVTAQSNVLSNGKGGSSTRFDFSQPTTSGHGTVNVGVALSEGLILAADSRLTLITTQTFPGYMVLSDNNSKVFAIGNFGISTYGEAFLSNRTVASWVADYAAKQHHKDDDVISFAQRFSDYVGGIYDTDAASKNNRIVGFLIAGYDKNGEGKLLSVEFPNSRKPSEVKNTKNTQGAQWFGDTETIVRLVKGYDPKLGLLPFLNTLNPTQQSQVAQQFNTLEYNIPWNALMLQDGVDFATSLVKMTVTFQRFSFGTVGNAGSIPSVGGAVDVLVVRPSGIEWVKQKTLVAN